jgi:ornithine cyclodeaminase/alanine dehydrogenase-like protein (mu-crystallin family)
MGAAAPVFISSEAAEKVFSWSEAIRAVADAYAASAPRSALPPRTVGSDDGAWLRTLPALPPGRRYFGAKVMGMATAAAEAGAEYVILLYDRETSSVAAFVDGHRVTAYRTAATSAAALDRLAAPGPIRLAVLGSGLEATMHVRAIAAVRPIAHMTVFSPTRDRREAFAASVATDLGIEVEHADEPEAAVAAAGVVLAAARSYGEQPILFAEWLAPDVTVVSIGSTVPSQREIAVSVVAVCDVIVCDDVEEVSRQTGDMLEAARAGIDFRARTFSLHELLAGELDEALASTRRRLYKSVGGGLQDVVVAEVVLRRALDAELATALPMEFEKKR